MEDNRKKKLLIVLQLIRRGGVELVAINFAQNLNPTKYDITIMLVSPNVNHDDELAQELIDSGIKIVKLSENIGGYIQKYKFIKEFLKDNRFDIVHSHTMFFSGFVMLAAKECGVKVRVSHSHATKWNRKENLFFKAYKNFTRFLINTCSTHLLSCSTQSGIYLYGKKSFEKRGQIITNGIDTKKYAYNEKARTEIRDEFSIKDMEILVGHIGSIYYIKNQTFLIEVFAKMLEQNSEMKLLLVGEEFDGDPVRKKIKEYNLNDKVTFAGRRNDITKIVQAMDIMIFPSLFEALPVSLIEAQASSLPCLISDSVTNEVKFNENVEFLSLNENAKVWADKAFELLKTDRSTVKTENLTKFYDISYVIKELNRIYMS